MDDTPTTDVELARPLDTLRERPTTIADAIERAGRIDVLTDWLKALRDDVRNGYVDTTARTIEQTTGGVFNVPAKGVGNAYRTQPEATPSIDDAEAFGRWYVSTLLDDDPDKAERDPLLRFDDHVARRLVATCDSTALLTFVNDRADLERWGDANARRVNVERLVDAIVVDVEWLVGETTLDAMIKGDAWALDEKRPRLKLMDWKPGHSVVDVESGEEVPGVRVAPARPGVLTIKADPTFKKALRSELDELLGPPALRE